jgi:hypothetical protein
MWRLTIVLAAVAIPAEAAAQCVADAEQIVQALYAQILERAPDRNSRPAVYDIAAERGTVRENVAGLAHSVEHQARFLWPPVVEAAFRATRGARPDSRLIEQASIALARGQTTVADMVATFAADEAATRDPGQQVALLYGRLLGRPPEGNTGAEYAQVAARQGIGAVAQALVTSDEYRQRFGAHGVPGVGPGAYEPAIRALYRHLLGREPEESGMQANAASAAHVGLAAVIDALLASDEYMQRFGEHRVPGPIGRTIEYCGDAVERPPANREPRVARPRR